MVETDKFLRTLGWERVAKQELDLLGSEETAILEAYSAGVNAYLQDHTGVELSLDEGFTQHMLVLGTNDPEYLHLRGGQRVLEKAAADGCLTVLAHPFRWEGGAYLLGADVRPDAIEYRTPNQVQPRQLQLAEEAAGRLGLPLVNAGDVHSMAMLNRFWIETDRPIHNARDIRRIILNGRYVNRIGG